jgi:hypothetical protein
MDSEPGWNRARAGPFVGFAGVEPCALESLFDAPAAVFTVFRGDYVEDSQESMLAWTDEFSLFPPRLPMQYSSS